MTADQLAYLDAFVPAGERGTANLLSDLFDGAVRWINPGGRGEPVGFVPKVVAAAGGRTRLTSPCEIAWRPAPDGASPAFPSYPAQTIAVLPDAWIKGKIVLIGAVQSITDRHRTPLAVIDDGERGQMPGIVIQAHGTRQLLDGTPAPSPGWPLVAGVTGAREPARAA